MNRRKFLSLMAGAAVVPVLPAAPAFKKLPLVDGGFDVPPEYVDDLLQVMTSGGRIGPMQHMILFDADKEDGPIAFLDFTDQPKEQSMEQIFTPLHDRVLIKQRAAETSIGNIQLPDQEKPYRGIVVAVGPGEKLPDGSRIPMSVQLGDDVFFRRGPVEPVTIDGERFISVRDTEILGVVEAE